MFLHTMIGLLWPAHAGVALAICRACPPGGLNARRSTLGEPSATVAGRFAAEMRASRLASATDALGYLLVQRRRSRRPAVLPHHLDRAGIDRQASQHLDSNPA